MSMRVISERTHGECAVDMEFAINAIGGRWKMMILAHLAGEGTMRFSDLERAIGRVSQKVLAQQLRSLESDGLIRRRVEAEVPVRVSYDLSEAGQSLAPVFKSLLDWARLRRSILEGPQAEQQDPTRKNP